MLDWEITENTTLPEEEPPSPLESSRSRRLFWGITLTTAVIVALAVFAVMRMRLEASETALAADLLTLVKDEEQARRFNLQERIDLLLAEGTPDEWRYRYLALFDTVTSSTPIQVTLEEVRLDGISALVQARIGEQLQRRHYLLTSQGWRRAPLPISAWGDSLFTYTYPNNERIRVQYYREDAEFAKAVMDDLPTLMATRNALGLEALEEFSLTITPQELSGVILRATPAQLTLNSPQLVVLPLDGPLTSVEAVRYQIASVLLQDEPRSAIQDETLPQNARFASTLNTVMALRWAMSPERYPFVRETWREATGNDWHSPFVTLPQRADGVDPLPPSAGNAALLVADAIYEQAGEAGMVTTLQRMQTATGWDEVFMASAEMTTLEIEAVAQGIAPPPIPALPLKGNLLLEEGGQISLAVPNIPQPITLTRTDERAKLQLPGGTYLPDACLALFPTVQVNGSWREAGRRLMVNQVIIPEWDATAYFTVTIPPTESVAVVGTWGSSGQLDGLSTLATDGTQTPVLAQAQHEPFTF